MNKQLLSLAGLVGLLAFNATVCRWIPAGDFDPRYKHNALVVHNKTSDVLNLHAYFYTLLCADDHAYIKPGQALVSTVKDCYIDRIAIDGAGTLFKGPYSGRIAFEITRKGPNNAITLTKVDFWTKWNELYPKEIVSKKIKQITEDIR